MPWAKRLIAWYHAHKREMPWRARPSPYAIWVSEMMLQQTQVDTVIPYFNRFMARFKTVEALADAELEEVLKLWEGLGYYSRARNLHKAARVVVSELNGALPTTYESLKQLPGLGPYTAAAIASIAFGEAVPVVDGNVIRVFARFFGIEDNSGDMKMRVALFERLTPFIKKHQPSDFNQAMMELGAMVCKPKNPQCTACPLQSECVAFQTNCIHELPVKSKKAKVPHYDIAVGVVWKRRKILIGRRKTDQMLGGLWEFPGGKKQLGETLQETVAREIREETGLVVTVGEPYCVVKHAYTHFKITLTAFRCDYVSGKEVPHTTDLLKWISPHALLDYPFPKANRRVTEAVIASL